MNIHDYLRDKRIQLGLSQKQLSKKIGVSQGLISKYEAGYCLPGFTAIKAYTDFYNISADELLGMKRV